MRDAITKAIDYYIYKILHVKAHNRIRRHDPYRAGSS